MVYTDGVHLVADTVEELHDFAKVIGLQRGWFQTGKHPHYDLLGSKSLMAFAAGAIRKRPREILLISMQLNEAGVCPDIIKLQQVDRLLEEDGYYLQSFPRKILNELITKLSAP